MRAMAMEARMRGRVGTAKSARYEGTGSGITAGR
jgi:hypothetical protein